MLPEGREEERCNMVNHRSGDLEKGVVRTERFEMEYFRFGEGTRTMVILPGLSVQSVMDSANAVEHEYREMEADFTVYVFDRRKALPRSYPVDEMARDTAEAMACLGLERVCLFGASQGGMMALRITLDHPEMVEMLALGSTCARVEERQFRELEHWASLARKGDGSALYEAFGKAIYPPAFMKKYGKAMLSLGALVKKEDLERFIILIEGTEGFDVSDSLAQIKCPVLVIGARDDVVLGPDTSQKIAEALKENGNCELFLYDGYGHAAFDTAPDYRTRLHRFFCNCSAPSAF